MKIVKQSAELLFPVSEQELLQKIELAGRVCYKSEDKITEDSALKFVNQIIQRNHRSVLEHVNITFRLITDRGVSHELVRHRLASYSQESTRYVRYGEIEVIEPVGLSEHSFKIWHNQMILSEINYWNMLNCKIAPEIARSVLPHSLKTELVVTMNLRELFHVLEMRGQPAAHPQIRELMLKLHKELNKQYPNIFKEGDIA